MRFRVSIAAFVMNALAATAVAQAKSDLAVFAAGSLRPPLTEIAKTFESK